MTLSQASKKNKIKNRITTTKMLTDQNNYLDTAGDLVRCRTKLKLILKMLSKR